MISIVIPTYNRISYIGSTLASIYQQKVDCELDIIVVDDGSADGTASWIKNRFPQLTVISQENRGVSEARNVGVRHAKSEIVAFCDSDDLMLPGRLASQYKFLNNNPSAVLVAGNYLDFNSWNGVSQNCRFNHTYLGLKKGASGLAKNFLKNSTKSGNPLFSTGMFRKSAFLSLGGFAASLRACEDFELSARISTIGNIGIIDRPLMLVRNDSHERISGTNNIYNTQSINPYEAMVDYWLREQLLLYEKNEHFRAHVDKWAAHVVMQAYSRNGASEISRLIRKYKRNLVVP